MAPKTLHEEIDSARQAAKRDHVLTIRLSTADWRRLAKVAKRQSIATATLARILILKAVEDLESKR